MSESNEELQETGEEVTVKSVSIKYGIINGLIGIIFFIIIDLSGQAGNQSVSWIGAVFGAIIIYLAHREFLKNGDGFMSYGQGLGIGTLLSLIASVMSGVFTYIYVSFINPGFVEIIRQQQVMELEKRGMSDMEIEQAMKMAENFTGPVALMLFGVIGGVFFGFIISLIVSAITKKSRPEFS